MTLFAINVDNVFTKGFDYYQNNLADIDEDEILYIVDTDDFKVEKIKAGDLVKHYSDNFFVSNIGVDDDGTIYVVEEPTDFNELLSFSGMNYCLSTKDCTIKRVFNYDSTITFNIDAFGHSYKLVYASYDENGNKSDSEDFNSESWYGKILINDKLVAETNLFGEVSLEESDFALTYCFRTKKFFVCRFCFILGSTPHGISFVFSKKGLADVYKSEYSELSVFDFDDKDTSFQTKSKLLGEPY